MQKKVALFLTFLLLFVSLVGCGSDTTVTMPDYTVVEEEDYGIALKNHSWRIVIDSNTSNEELLAVFEELDKSKYEETTVWFYSSEELAESSSYDVAMIERTGKEEPVITK